MLNGKNMLRYNSMCCSVYAAYRCFVWVFPGIDLLLLFQKLWRGWGSFSLCNHSCDMGCCAARDLILGPVLNHTQTLSKHLVLDN